MSCVKNSPQAILSLEIMGVFYLTPQERVALICLLLIFCFGTLASIALKKDARILRWVKTAHQIQSAYPLDINSATVEDLDKLPGIGLKTARRILDYRQSHGKFRSAEDVRKVKGISKKILEGIAPYCRFEGPL